MAKKSLFFISLFVALLHVVSLSGCAGSSSSSSDSYLNYIPSKPDLISDYPPETVSGKSAFEYLKAEKVHSGWNLGNTLDSHRNGYAGETTWGNPAANQALMKGVKAAGFDIIRIPVTWMGDIGLPPDHRISATRLKRVGEIAAMAKEAGLKVIINLHHDGATESGGSDVGWLSIGKASRNNTAYDTITAKYARVWKQIAEYFKNYGEWLIFESFNELHDGNWQTCTDPGQFIVLNKWNQLFVDIVRSTGSNNESRYLMVGAYCNDNHHALSAGFLLPTDPSQNKLIVSFHYYAPYEFAIKGSRSSWGTTADKQKVESDFSPFKTRFIDNNIPVIIGECGAVLQLYPNDSAKQSQAQQSRMDYISYVFNAAKKYGLVPVYWDNGLARGDGEKFGLINRATGQPNSPDSEALITAMTNVVN
ncbi:MAG: glycoside hydrolase family 5 protein [Treponema sp.]|nr:glycoside hydrolase family 5 protein [Treponema sp.]MCL2252093.1 glycoside hydrolase family 5 protein [Treponema sp.]